VNQARPPVQLMRASLPSTSTASPLGLLKNLAGSWIGSGFNLIALPNKQNGGIFRLMLNATHEVLDFSPIGAPVPNRGSLQDDIFLTGLTYLQRVSDKQSHAALHIEPGIWLNVPPTSDPSAPATIVRQSTIPHGDSLLAQGTAFEVNGGPQIAPVSSTPTGPGTGQLGYLDPYLHSDLPPGITQAMVGNPNQLLVDAIQGQNITNTVVLEISTTPVGGIVNIPFITQNANATKLDAIFWIETVELPDGEQFMQLQYTQTVILNFDGIDWPHISVATMVKQ